MNGNTSGSKIETGNVTRRGMLQLAAGVAAGAMVGVPAARAAETASPTAAAGRLKQSIVQWCFEKYWDMPKLVQIAKQLGCGSIELVEPKWFPLLKENGLVSAITGSHGFVKGMNNPKYYDWCFTKLRESIDACAEVGFPNVITFTGMAEDVPADVGLENCVRGFKQIVGYAEQKKITLCIEILNSRVPVEMKGHPGYQGDHCDYCIEIIKRVGSPRLKILFDIYHVQIMDGDIISRLRQHKDYIGHIHTAGNPGRNELDEKQEINYRPIFQTLAEIGYQGFVGHEFIPTRDPLQGLQEAVKLATV